MHHLPPPDEAPTGPGFFERLCKRLVFIVLGAMTLAGLIHLYRVGQLPIVQQPLPGFDHPLFSPATPSDPSETSPAPGLGAAPVPPQPPGSPTSSPSATSSPFVSVLGVRRLPPMTWTHQDLADISLEAPMPILRQPPSGKYFNQAQMRQILQLSEWEGKIGDEFSVGAFFMRIDGTHTLSMEDGVRGGIHYLSVKSGDPSPAVRRTDVWVDGVPGRYLSYTRVVNGVNWHFEMLILQNVRDALIIDVIFAGDGHLAESQRILSSVRVRK